MPEGICADCGRERSLVGRGMCSGCYKRTLRQEKQTDERMAMATAGDVEQGGNLRNEAGSGEPVLGDPAAGPAPVPELTDSPYLTPGERPPGGVGTPSSSLGGVGSEVPPAAPARGLRKLFPKKDKAETLDSPAPKTTEKRPGRSPKRMSAADTIGDVYSGLGSLAVQSGRHAPLGRCMQWQAPIAGEMLDDAVSGTIVDKVVLQKVVGARGKFDLLAAVVGPPMLVLAIERNPQNAEAIMPLLRSSIRSALPQMVPAIKKVQKRQKEVAEATALLFEDDPNFTPGDDPVDHILAMMFADWIPPQPVPVPDEPVEDSVA